MHRAARAGRRNHDRRQEGDEGEGGNNGGAIQISGEEFTRLLQRMLASELLQEEQAGAAGDMGPAGEDGPERPRERLGESGFAQIIAQILLQGMGDASGGMTYEQLVALQERMGGAGKLDYLTNLCRCMA